MERNPSPEKSNRFSRNGHNNDDVFSPIHNLEMVDEKSDGQQSVENEENEYFWVLVLGIRVFWEVNKFLMSDSNSCGPVNHVRVTCLTFPSILTRFW